MTGIFLFFLTFFTVALALPTYRVWRQTGVNPIVLSKADDAAGFVGKSFKLLILLLGIHLLLGIVKLALPVGTITLPDLAAPLGWTLLIASLLWVVIAQFQMGRSWRVGVDTSASTDLVTHGLFRFSRNPIFLGMQVQLFGLFLVLPDAITFAILIAGFILISVQIRLEEQYLAGLHGDAYARYCRAVRRWL